MQNFDGRHEDISVVCTYCEDCVWNFCRYSMIKKHSGYDYRVAV